MTNLTKKKKHSVKKQKVPLYRKKVVSKKFQKPDYWKEYMKENAQKNPSCWDVDTEMINPKDPFGIGFDPKEDMSFLPEIPK